MQTNATSKMLGIALFFFQVKEGDELWSDEPTLKKEQFNLELNSLAVALKNCSNGFGTIWMFFGFLRNFEFLLKLYILIFKKILCF
jgi:hypothetical protein